MKIDNKWERIKKKFENLEEYSTLYQVSITIILILYESYSLVMTKVLFLKVDDVRVRFISYLIFFGIYGPFKKIRFRNFFVRIVISSLILIIIFILVGEKI